MTFQILQATYGIHNNESEALLNQCSGNKCGTSSEMHRALVSRLITLLQAANLINYKYLKLSGFKIAVPQSHPY